MKKIKFALLLALLSTSALMKAQVGINTPTPASTLDVTAKNATGTTTNADGILIPRVDRQRAQSMTGVATSTIIYVNSVATGTQAGTAINIGTIGFYYFDGSTWVRLSATSTNAFVPSVVAAGTANNSVIITDGTAFNKFVFTASTNDGNWSVANNTYTTPKAGFYQISLQSLMTPNKSANSFAWDIKYDSTIYQLQSISNVAVNNTVNSGGVIVLYLTANQAIQIGGYPCSGCAGGSTYNITTRSFTITYLGS